MKTAKSEKSVQDQSTETAKTGKPGLNSVVFRQTRYTNDSIQLWLSVENQRIKIKNWSRTGISFEGPENLLKVNQVVNDIKIYLGDLTLYEGDIEIKNCIPSSPSHVQYGAAFITDLFPTEGVDSAVSIMECDNQLNKLRDDIEKTNPEFCQSVLALSSALHDIKRVCIHEEERWRNLPLDQKTSAEKVFLPNMSKKVRKIFVYFNIKIARQVNVEELPENSMYHRIFKEEIYPFFESADVIRRAYEKPRGYAGDYEVMNQIYRDGYEGKDLFGRVLHNYITNENSGESVKYRKPFFIRYYNEIRQSTGPKKVLAVACGPAVEYQEIVTTWSQEDLSRIEVTLFDLDREALEHAQTKLIKIGIREKKKPNAVFVNASVKAFLVSNYETGSTYDLIYSGGLFDYLDNQTSSALVRKFAGMLNPGGTLIVGNFTKDNLTKAFLHLLTNWTLIHKTEGEVRSWATGIEGCSVDVEFDKARMHAFLVLRKNATR